MSITHHLRGPLAAALAIAAAAAPAPAGATLIPLDAQPAPTAHTQPPPTWPAHPQVLTPRTTSAPSTNDGPSWTATGVVGCLLVVAAASLGVFAGRMSRRPLRRVRTH
jgi:hypothetical protein